MNKTPNPYGKYGCPEHRKKIAEIAAFYIKKGFRVIFEVPIRLLNGKKRYIDLGVEDENGDIAQYHQVGKGNKNGTPVAREKRVLDEIEISTGKRPIFHIYLFLLFFLLLLSVKIA